LADEVIRDAAARRVPLVAVGERPLYYKALFEGLFEGPGADESVRQRLRAEPLEALHAKLSQVDPVAATRIHANDRRRLIRALEIYELPAGQSHHFQTEWASGRRRGHQAIWFGLSWEKDCAHRRINARVRANDRSRLARRDARASRPLRIAVEDRRRGPLDIVN
jgi:tRNA dimethylallyltransferase